MDDDLKDGEDWENYTYYRDYCSQYRLDVARLNRLIAEMNNKMMEIERRRPDIMQRIILENDNDNSSNDGC